MTLEEFLRSGHAAQRAVDEVLKERAEQPYDAMGDYSQSAPSSSPEQLEVFRRQVDPRDVACPTCQAKAGSPCKRPSGHNVFGGGYHSPRIKAATEGVR